MPAPAQPFLTQAGGADKVPQWDGLRPARVCLGWYGEDFWRHRAASGRGFANLDEYGRISVASLGRFEHGLRRVRPLASNGLITSLFGSSNARYIKKLQPTVDSINALESKYQAMTDDELREQTAKFRKRLAAGETLDDLLVEAFAVCREAGRRVLGDCATTTCR